VCGEPFLPPRSDGRYCSSACRQKAYRRRRLPPPLPAGLVEERPEQGGWAWCTRCPDLWAWARSRAEALWLVEEHMARRHPEVVR
jgi:hypothetical protein